MINALLVFLLLGSPAPSASPEPLPTPQILHAIRVRAPKAELRLQVAATPLERERGLMSVTHLALHSGMVFVFDKDAPVAFWMKDTLISLDMVFVSDSGLVRKIFASVPVVSRTLPDNEIPLEQGNARYVIELAAGEAAKDGLRPGVHLRGLPVSPSSRSKGA